MNEEIYEDLFKNVVINGHYPFEKLNEMKNYIKILNIKIENLEQQVKKQKEVIDNYKEDISNLLDIINKNCNELKCTSDEWLVMQKYQDKEVSE